jgi:hypothetical protein
MVNTIRFLLPPCEQNNTKTGCAHRPIHARMAGQTPSALQPQMESSSEIFRHLEDFWNLDCIIYIYVYWMYLLIVYKYMYTISIWLYLDTFGCCFGTLFESFERPLSIYELIPVGKMPLAALCSGKMELAILLLATCSCEMLIYSLPSGKLTVCYWKWPFIVDLRIKHCDFP